MSENEIREYALMKATFKWLLIGMLSRISSHPRWAR